MMYVFFLTCVVGLAVELVRPNRTNNVAGEQRRAEQRSQVEDLLHERLDLGGPHAEQDARVLVAHRLQVVHLAHEQRVQRPRRVEAVHTLEVPPQQPVVALLSVRHLRLRAQSPAMNHMHAAQYGS